MHFNYSTADGSLTLPRICRCLATSSFSTLVTLGKRERSTREQTGSSLATIRPSHCDQLFSSTCRSTLGVQDTFRKGQLLLQSSEEFVYKDKDSLMKKIGDATDVKKESERIRSVVAVWVPSEVDLVGRGVGGVGVSSTGGSCLGQNQYCGYPPYATPRAIPNHPLRLQSKSELEVVRGDCRCRVITTLKTRVALSLAHSRTHPLSPYLSSASDATTPSYWWWYSAHNH